MSRNYLLKGGKYPTIEEVQEILKDYSFEILEEDNVGKKGDIEKDSSDTIIRRATLYSEKTKGSKNTIFITSIKKHEKWVVESFRVYRGDNCSEFDNELQKRGYQTSIQ